MALGRQESKRSRFLIRELVLSEGELLLFLFEILWLL
jgi:hypothetical protein